MQALMVKPMVKVKGLSWRGDPTFSAGASKTARATLTNNTGQALICTTELYVDVTKVFSSGVSSPFTIPAGGSVDLSYIVLFTKAGGPYHVYIDVWSGSTLLTHYQATEDVTVLVALAFTFGVPTVEIVPGAGAYRTANFSCVVKNNNNQSVTRTLFLVVMIQNGQTYTPGEGSAPVTVTVTLSPGQSYTYSLLGHSRWDPVYGNYYDWFSIPFGGWIKLWLQDDLGNKSQVMGPYS